MKKHIVVIPDGAADTAGGGSSTPLESARTPWLDRMASRGRVGRIMNTPSGFPPGSDVAILSLLGFSPEKGYTGRGPLEAAAMGIPMGKGDFIMRMNLVGIKNGLMDDYSAGHISTRDSGRIIKLLNSRLDEPGVRFFTGSGYRHIARIKGNFSGLELTPPHDITGRKISRYLPSGPGSGRLIGIMERARKIISSCGSGGTAKTPATDVWFWGGGGRPALPSFRKVYGRKAAVITAVNLVKGIAGLCGMDVIKVPGITGYLDTDYAAKAEYALRNIKRYDMIFIHVEAPDEAGHEGSFSKKKRAIEDIDRHIIRPLYGHVLHNPGTVCAVIPDHPTPVSRKTHVRGHVPFLVFGGGENRAQAGRFTEKYAASSGFELESFSFINFLLGQ